MIETIISRSKSSRFSLAFKTEANEGDRPVRIFADKEATGSSNAFRTRCSRPSSIPDFSVARENYPRKKKPEFTSSLQYCSVQSGHPLLSRTNASHVPIARCNTTVTGEFWFFFYNFLATEIPARP